MAAGMSNDAKKTLVLCEFHAGGTINGNTDTVHKCKRTN